MLVGKVHFDAQRVAVRDVGAVVLGVVVFVLQAACERASGRLEGERIITQNPHQR